MAREFAREFYNSTAWMKCARAYKKYRRGLCENCLAKGIYTPGVIVHHVVHLDPINISDPKIALSFDNLRLVCRDCHAAEHAREKRYFFDEAGRLKIPPTSEKMEKRN